MSTAARLGIYGLILVVTFVAAWGLGSAVGDPPPEPHMGDRVDEQH